MGFFCQPDVIKWMFHPNESRKKLLNSLNYASSELGDISTALAAAEIFGDASVAAKISQYREKLDGVAERLALPATVVKNIQSALKITKAVAELQKMGPINQNNARAAARAFGKLFSGIGELASYLPPPINGWFEIFAEAEEFFLNLQEQLVPHMKGTHRRVDELHMQGGDRSLWEMP